MRIMVILGKTSIREITLLPNTARLRELIRKHGSIWKVEGSAVMSCFGGEVGLKIASLDGRHKRNVRFSDINTVI